MFKNDNMLYKFQLKQAVTLDNRKEYYSDVEFEGCIMAVSTLYTGYLNKEYIKVIISSNKKS